MFSSDDGKSLVDQGLGVMMVQAASQYKVNIVFAGMIVFMALSLAMTSIVKLLESRLGRWRPQQRVVGE